jgi:hemoglobin
MSQDFWEETMSDETKTLYERLGGYDAIAAVANDLLPRLRADPQLGRFWAHRGEDGIMREKQLLIDFLCASAGGSIYYRGRDMTLTHRGMRISDSDWNVFLGHAAATLAKFQVPEAERREVVAFVQSLKKSASNVDCLIGLVSHTVDQHCDRIAPPPMERPACSSDPTAVLLQRCVRTRLARRNILHRRMTSVANGA